MSSEERPAFDVQHRDCFESLAAMRDAGGADLILTSPPYPDARSDEAYGASFDTSLEGYAKLGDATFEALKPGGVCALNIDGPVRVWRPELGETERSMVSMRVAIDWADRVGFRYLEHCWYGRDGFPISAGPRWRSGGEPLHVFARPGVEPFFDRYGSTRAAKYAGKRQTDTAWSARHKGGLRSVDKHHTQGDRRSCTTSERHVNNAMDGDHEAAFAPSLADDYVLCYSPPGGLVGDPFVGSGTVAFSCHRHGRRFIGGDLGTRQTHNGKPCGRRWADIVNDGLRQGRLFS